MFVLQHSPRGGRGSERGFANPQLFGSHSYVKSSFNEPLGLATAIRPTQEIILVHMQGLRVLRVSWSRASLFYARLGIKDFTLFFFCLAECSPAMMTPRPDSGIATARLRYLPMNPLGRNLRPKGALVIGKAIDEGIPLIPHCFNLCGTVCIQKFVPRPRVQTTL